MKSVARAMLALSAVGAMLATGPRGREQDGARVRFEHVDVYVDAGAAPLGAYQVEVEGTKGRVIIVGIEGGEHAAYRNAPYYDAAAMQQERVILGAFSLGAELPTGSTRVARVHVMVSGEAKAEYTVSLTTAATSGGIKIGASAEVRRGEDQ